MKYMIRDPNGKPRQVSIEIEEIDKQKAEKYLSYNYNSNRHLNPNTVDTYKRDMMSHAWEFTGQSIVFDSNGRLIDGQHRLHAIKDSGETVQMIVIRGVSPKSVIYIDRGKSRSFRDVMRIENNDSALKYSATQAAIRKAIKNEVSSTLVLSTDDLKWLFERLEPECNVLERILPHTLSKPINADFRGACLGALIYGLSQADLAEYISAFLSDMPTTRFNNDAAFDWKNKVSEKPDFSGRRLDGKQMYFGTQNSIYYFLNPKEYNSEHTSFTPKFPIRDKLIPIIQERYIKEVQ